VNCCSGAFNIGLVGTVGGQCVRSVFFLISYFLYCHSNEPCTLHSLIVRLMSYVSCSQSPAKFTTSSAYTASTARPSLYQPHPHNETPQEGVNSPYQDNTGRTKRRARRLHIVYTPKPVISPGSAQSRDNTCMLQTLHFDRRP